MKSTALFTIAMMALLGSTAFVAADSDNTLTDIAGSTHENAIRQIVDAGIVTGYRDGTFRPSQPVTRGQFATFLSRALNLPDGQSSFFTDVSGHAHASAISALVDAQITSGFPDGTFRPNESITRGQVATFLARGFGLTDDPNTYFSDTRNIVHSNGISAATGAGLVSGFPDGQFYASRTVTRGQLATFVGRSIGVVSTATPPAPLPEPLPEQFPLAPQGTTFRNGILTGLTPGTYRSAGATGTSCYWARLSGTTGAFSEIITNNISRGPTIVTIASSDVAFESSGCQLWEAVQDTYPTSPAQSFDDGTHVIGRHIEPGTYTTGASSGCYYARLSGFGKVGVQDIIVNNNTNDPVVLTILESDVGFISSRCGVWTRQ